MDSSEKKTYILAIIIVISGTLLITVGFTMGLLFLTMSDNDVTVVNRNIIDINETENLVLSYDMLIDLDYNIISGDLTDERALVESHHKMSIEEYLISLDIFMRNSNGRRSTSWDTIGRHAEKQWILIDKSNFSLALYNRDKLLHKWRIAVGIVPGDKQRKGDNKTPNGIFRINQIQNSSEWTYDFGDGRGQTRGAYGPWFIRLHTPPWSGIGIHGTHDPESIGSRASEGCIRMNNDDVSELRKMVRLGMPVIIVE